MKPLSGIVGFMLLATFFLSSTTHLIYAQTISQIGLDIDGEAANDFSGSSLSMPNSTTLAIGSWRNDGNGTDAGQVRVFEWNGTSWIQKGSDIDGEAAGDFSGYAISMADENTIAIGAYRNSGGGSFAGHVRVYRWNGISWIQKGVDLDGTAANQYFGSSVSMPDPNTLAVGALWNSDVFSQAGAVTVYRWNGIAWVQKGSNIYGDAASDFCGSSVVMPDANTLAVGAERNDAAGPDAGQIRIYRWNGSAWAQKGSDLLGDAAGDLFGRQQISMPDSNTIAGGGQFNDDAGADAGHTKIYRWDGNNWVQKGTDIDGEAAGDRSGNSMSMPNPDIVVVGANLNDGNGADAGHARIFRWDGSNWVQFGADIDGDAAGDGFGNSVSMPNANYVAIGGPGNDDFAIDAGQVKVFNFCPPTTGTITATECASYFWGGTILTASGIYQDTLQSVNGCDSVVSLNLTINSPPTLSIDQGDTASFCFGDSILLSASGSGTASSYRWYQADSAKWEAVGQLGITPGNGVFHELFSFDDTLWIAHKNIALNVLTLYKFDGTNWVVAGPPNGLSVGSTPSIAVVADSIFFAYQDAANSQRVTVAKFDRSSWSIVGSAGFSPRGVSYIDLKTYNGRLYLSHTEPFANGKAFVWRYNGVNWVSVGSPGFSPGTSAFQQIGINDNGRLFVTFADGSLGDRTSVMTYDGSSWVYLGNPGFSVGASSNHDLIVYNDRPVVAYSDGGNSYIKTFDGSNWVDVGNIGEIPSANSFEFFKFNGRLYLSIQNAILGNIEAYRFGINGWRRIGDPVSNFSGVNRIRVIDETPYMSFVNANVSNRLSVFKYQSFLLGNGNSIYVKSGGNISVESRSGAGCKSSDTIFVIEGSALISSITLDSTVSCFGAADGGATASAVGGLTPYTYNWSNSATTASVSNLGNITYFVTITDANGCTDSSRITITQPPNLFLSVSGFDVSCNGLNNGQAGTTVLGGTPPYTYNWSNSATSSTISGLTAGTYSLTVTDNNGCNIIDSIIISEPPALNETIVVDSNASCFGSNDGGLTATAAGGTAPYTYNWNNSGTTASIDNLSAGVYTVTITDFNGCFTTASDTITEPAPLSVNAGQNLAISCFGDSDGSVLAIASGGTGAYTYLWSNSVTTIDNPNISAGTYSVTVTDANGCSNSTSYVLGQPSLLIATPTIVNGISCFGASDGDLTVFAIGGIQPYTYSWNNSTTTANNNGLSGGAYSVTVTDNRGCTDTASIILSEPPLLTLASNSVTDASCFGLSDGSATLSPTGGTPPYAYNWSNSATTNSISGLAAGTYNFTITDNNGCSLSNSISINQPALLVSNVNVDSNTSCFGSVDGGLTASASGGTAPYTYLWFDNSTDSNITALAGGSFYSVTITDNNGCSAIDSAQITEPPILLSQTTLVNDVSCNGGNNGKAYASGSGGTPPFTYNWSNSASTDTVSNLSAATYSVTITDNNGCTNSASIAINEPAALVASAVQDSSVSCYGTADGGASVSGIGGTQPYTYNWSNSQTAQAIVDASGSYLVTITDANGCTDSASTFISTPDSLDLQMNVIADESCAGAADGRATVVANGGTSPLTYSWSNGPGGPNNNFLSAGVYQLTVTDRNGCSKVDSVTISIDDQVSPTAIAQNISVYLDVNGLISIDSNAVDNNSSDNCQIDSMSTSPSSFNCSNTGLGGNQVQFIVYDSNGNSDTTTSVVTVIDSFPPVFSNVPVNIIVGNDAGACGANVNWTPPMAADACGISSVSSNANPGAFFPIGDSLVRYIAIDQNQNRDTAEFLITVNDNETPNISNVPASINLGTLPGRCDQQANWTAPTASDNCSISSFTSNFNPGDTFVVGATTIEYIATDGYGNADTASFNVIVADTENPGILCLADTVICTSTYSFSPPIVTDNCGIASVVQIAGIPSGGTYPVGSTTNTFEVTDVNGNINSCSFIVNRSLAPTAANAGPDQNICDDNTVLNANTPQGGTASWSSLSGTVTFDDPTDPQTTVRNLATGSNQLIWTISSGVCPPSVDTVVINVDQAPSNVNSGANQLLCNGRTTLLSADPVSSGIGSWSVISGGANVLNTNDPSTRVTSLSLGINQFVWTVTNGSCSPIADTTLVLVAPPLNVDAGPNLSVYAQEGVELNAVSNRSIGINYLWSPSNFISGSFNIPNPFAIPAQSTYFVVEVTDSLGCTAKDSVFVEVVGDLVIPTAFTPNQDGFNDRWEIKGLDLYPEYTISVYNGFGSELFSTKNYEEAWDGKYNGEDLPTDSYYFVIELINGQGEKNVETGIITIVR